jgi:RHS repeat-associated protein
VSEYLTSAGVVAAHFEYDPFGNITGFTEQSQGLAAGFGYRFSTKPIDDISGWYYYGYRYYDSVTGRWPSRDPIGERGGVNLYGFVGNDSLSHTDMLGLEFEDWTGTVDSLESFGAHRDTLNEDGHVVVRFFGQPKVYKIGEKCCVKIEQFNPETLGLGPGYFKVSEFWIKPGKRNNYKKIDDPYSEYMPHSGIRGMTTIEHERHHVRLYHKHYKQLQKYANPHEKCYNTMECANAAADLIRANKDYYYARARSDNRGFDIASYGQSNPESGRENRRLMDQYDGEALKAKDRIGEASIKLMKCDGFEIVYGNQYDY